MPTVQVATRIDGEQSRLFRETAARLGTTPADALRMFVAAFNEYQGFPYEVRTRAACEARDRRGAERVDAGGAPPDAA